VTVVVTGASGFIGRPLVTALLGAGREVIALTRDARRIEQRPGLRVIETGYGTFDLPAGCTIVHLAAVRNAPGTRASDLAEANVALTGRLGRAAVAARAARFINIATALVLGSSRTPLDETAPLAETGDPYADPYVASKIAGIRALEAIDGLPLVTLLPAIVYGPDHPAARNRVTAHMRRVLARPWRVAVGGEAQPRNLVFVGDVVAAIRQAENAPAGTRRLVAGENATQDDLERAVFAAAGREPTPRVAVPRALVRGAGRIADTFLRREQGWLRRIDTLLSPWCFQPGSPHTSLRDGVDATLRSL
jgi:nucleoside-diphosphate-sugar epimerase